MRAQLVPLPCATVLVVEDDPSTREMLCMLLEAEGHECVTASTGAEALALCRTRHFDCMLIDATIGAMSGVSVAQRLGGSDSVMGPTHVYLMTGHAKSDFATALRERVVDGHILKPADIHELAEVVRASMYARAASLA